ncbi:MAG TPA: nitrile hydratase subunit alpha [Polyangiaceae bacterium]|jgi:nitrile hydratase
MTHDHDADHDHDHDHDAHAPIEANDDAGYFDRLETAMRELLIGKGIVDADEIRRAIETFDARSPAIGAKVVARAWVDPQFRARLFDDAIAACEEMGVTMFDGTKLIALENTERVHNVVVCTLCSCYPRPLLGLPPDWYKSKAYRSRVVRWPREVLAEFGTSIPADIDIRVHDSTASMRYLVVPARPPGTEHMTEEQLAELVTRDTMIGVALPQSAPA